MTINEFNNAVDQYADRLYRYALKQAGDEALASDMVQEAFEVLWLNRKKINFEKARGYLLSTAHNRIIDVHRREQRKIDYEEVNAENHYYCQEYSGTMEFIDDLLNHLAPEQKSVLLLRDYEGYKYKEIAEITGLSVSQVKVYIHRARKYLKHYIGKMDNLL